MTFHCGGGCEIAMFRAASIHDDSILIHQRRGEMMTGASVLLYWGAIGDCSTDTSSSGVLISCGRDEQCISSKLLS